MSSVAHTSPFYVCSPTLQTRPNFIQSQSFPEALEREYTNLGEEKARLESKLADLANRENQQDSLMALAKQVQHILASWV